MTELRRFEPLFPAGLGGSIVREELLMLLLLLACGLTALPGAGAGAGDGSTGKLLVISFSSPLPGKL